MFTVKKRGGEHSIHLNIEPNLEPKLISTNYAKCVYRNKSESCRCGQYKNNNTGNTNQRWAKELGETEKELMSEIEICHDSNLLIFFS